MIFADLEWLLFSQTLIYTGIQNPVPVLLSDSQPVQQGKYRVFSTNQAFHLRVIPAVERHDGLSLSAAIFPIRVYQECGAQVAHQNALRFQGGVAFSVTRRQRLTG